MRRGFVSRFCVEGILLLGIWSTGDLLSRNEKCTKQILRRGVYPERSRRLLRMRCRTEKDFSRPFEMTTVKFLVAIFLHRSRGVILSRGEGSAFFPGTEMHETVAPPSLHKSSLAPSFPKRGILLSRTFYLIVNREGFLTSVRNDRRWSGSAITLRGRAPSCLQRPGLSASFH